MVLGTLLDQLVARNGSDLHLIVGQPPVFRVDGKLEREDTPPITADDMNGMLIPLLSEGQRAQLDTRKQGVDFTIRRNEQAFRCQFFHEQERLGAAIRSIPTHVPTLDQLGLEELLSPILQSPRGLVIVSGLAGSGKTTTCAAMLETINRTSARRILTIEDPIDYTFESKESLITQHTIGQDVESFETGMRMALNADPDVIFVGELRSLDALHMAMVLANTGHLVFTVMHSETASETVTRLVDAFPPAQQPMIRRLLARTLTAVVAQRLVVRADRPGRVAANEVLLANARVRRMIAEGQADLTVAIEAARDSGMQTMDDSLLRLYKAGTISYDSAWSDLQDKERLGPHSDAPGQDR